jgi:SacI homology domain
LISITQREQVAQIFGKPIFVITDVAFTPLTSQTEANQAIAEAIAAQKGVSLDHGRDSSDESDLEPIREPQTPGDPIDTSPTPDDDRPLQERSGSGTSIVKDVISNRGQYGKVASQWFSRKAWAQGKVASATGLERPSNDPTSDALEPSDERSEKEAGNMVATTSSQDAAVALIPKILKSTRLILTSRSFFFSYDTDLTHRMGTRTLDELNYNKNSKTTPDPRYFWNKNLATEFTSSSSFLLPIMQGFIGQRSFVVKREHKHTRAIELLEAVDATKADSPETDPASPGNCSQTFLLTLISRRSTKRSGLRYLRRGIDDDGNCANAVETEQILCSPTWEGIKIRSFTQYRGSIPIYFSQTPYAFKPVPVLLQSSIKNQAAMKKHFEALEEEYGGVQAALLVDKHGPEVKIGEAYEAGVHQLNETLKPPVDMYWFDFHAECRGMKFENVDRLVKILQNKIDLFGETVLEKGMAKQTQSGIIRTNCMDCLDRTNVAQSAFGQYVLQKDLQDEGYQIDLIHDVTTQWFNSLWADNGDAISRQYAGTAALKV